MNEKLLKLIKEYKERKEYLSKLIAELSIWPQVNERELDAANLARVLWRKVIQDLEKIVR